MITEISRKRIEQVRNKLEEISTTDAFFAQNIINCDIGAREIASDLFGEGNDYLKALDEAKKLNTINRRESILKVNMLNKVLLPSGALNQ